MPAAPRRPRIHWQDDAEYLRNRDRIVSETPPPSAEPPVTPAGDADEKPSDP
ncbi:hypothetical protein [Nonomuraea sp. NPDC049709]|uniref:hypothetical protein n=1 Tax=Nonomuraea sp. NPDC049709 TaxID=3154736 RepID=UPI00342A121D